MRSPGARLVPGLLLAGSVLAPGSASGSVVLAADNAATSVWDTDPTKVGVELQIVNHGLAAACDVRVTGVAVQGGALSGQQALPIVLGDIGPQSWALLDLVIAVPRTDGTGYLLTISGTYRSAGTPQRFSLTRTLAPGAAATEPIAGQNGVLGKASVQPAGPSQSPGAGQPSPGVPATS